MSILWKILMVARNHMFYFPSHQSECMSCFIHKIKKWIFKYFKASISFDIAKAS